MESFSAEVKEALDHYVYILINPLDNKIFYVGQGKEDRIFAHAKDALLDPKENDKLDVIREIKNKGEELKYYILRHKLSKEEARLVESVFIDFLIFKDFKFVSNITNIAAGYHQWYEGIKTVQEIEQIYSCEPLDINNKRHKLLCININNSYDKDKDIYEVVRRSWKLNQKRANEVDYVIAEYRGISRAIFKVNDKGWYVDSENPERYCFEGVKVEDKEICDLYLNKKIPRSKGSSNPIRYLD